jgi:hypothetical protein
MAVPILSDIFGTKPNIAPYEPTIFSEEQLRALKENINAFPEITKLGDLYQTYMTDAYNRAIPGFSDILATGGKLTQQMQATAGEELAGKIPQDVVDLVNRSSAYQNLMAGTAAGGPSGMAMSNTARNLGLTSLDMISKGAELQQTAGNAAARWAGLAGGLIMGPSGFLVTPAMQAELTMSNRLHKQATEQLRENVKAAPDPIAKGLSDIVENLTAAYLGGKVGTIGAGNEAATKATESGATSLNPAFETAGPGNAIEGGSGFSFLETGGGGFGGGGGGSSGSGPMTAGFGYGAGYPSSDLSMYYGFGNSPLLNSTGTGMLSQNSLFSTGI